MKKVKELSLVELEDYWWGYLLIEIGKGKGKAAISLMLMQTFSNAYDKGKDKGRKAL